MTPVKINYYGQLRRIPRVAGRTYYDNIFEAGLCDPCNDLPGCEDTLTIVSANAVTSILYEHVVDGVAVQTTIPIGATGATAVEAAIIAALSLYEFDLYVHATVSGSNFILKHRGQGKIISALVVTTGTVTATRVCTIFTRCNYSATIGGTLATLEIDGTNVTLVDIVYGVDSAAAAKTKLDTALALISPPTAGSVVGGATATVTDNPDESAYDIVISARDAHSFVIGSTGPTESTTFAKSSCEMVFEA